MAQKEPERAALVARVLEIGKEFDALGDTPADDRAAVRLADEVITISDRLDVLERQNKMEDLRSGMASGRYKVESGTSFDKGANYNSNGDPFESPGRETPSEIRSRALSGIEKWNAEDSLKESATAMLEASAVL